MRSFKLVVLALLVLAVSACSSSRAGSGAGDELGGESNIPVASSGDVLRDVRFAYDSATLEGQAQSLLQANADWLLKNSNVDIVVEGHCDERGTVEYNLALGERRAKSVRDFLGSLGVGKDRIDVVSYGEELPLDPGHTEESWAKNRRAHFAIKR